MSTLQTKFDLTRNQTQTIYKNVPLKENFTLEKVKNKTQAKEYAKLGHLVIAKNCKEKFVIDGSNKKRVDTYRLLETETENFFTTLTSSFNLIQGKFEYYICRNWQAYRRFTPMGNDRKDKTRGYVDWREFFVKKYGRIIKSFQENRINVIEKSILGFVKNKDYDNAERMIRKLRKMADSETLAETIFDEEYRSRGYFSSYNDCVRELNEMSNEDALNTLRKTIINYFKKIGE